ncbi:MAG: glycosyltransferase family 2 protein [Actinomycetota bacterium]
MKLLAIVPAYNEEGAVAQVVREIREAHPGADVLVVDDGSHDATAETAHAAGARVARLPFNLGIGGAVQTGYRVAWEEGYDVAVQIDGDGQHRADQLPRLLGPLREGAADYVIGSRFAERTGYRAPLSRRGGIIILSRVVSLIVGRRMTDTTSGFRAAGRRAIELFAAHYPHDYPEVEATVMAARDGMRVLEVPVEMRPRATGRSSISPLRSGYYMVKVLLAVGVQCIGRRPKPEEAAA